MALLRYERESSPFTSLIQARGVDGEELRFDPIAGGDLYHGRAPDASPTSALVWEVVRFYRDASGNILRARYVSGIAWDDRASGANWP